MKLQGGRRGVTCVSALKEGGPALCWTLGVTGQHLQVFGIVALHFSVQLICESPHVRNNARLESIASAISYKTP